MVDYCRWQRSPVHSHRIACEQETEKREKEKMGQLRERGEEIRGREMKSGRGRGKISPFWLSSAGLSSSLPSVGCCRLSLGSQEEQHLPLLDLTGDPCREEGRRDGGMRCGHLPPSLGELEGGIKENSKRGR